MRLGERESRNRSSHCIGCCRGGHHQRTPCVCAAAAVSVCTVDWLAKHWATFGRRVVVDGREGVPCRDCEWRYGAIVKLMSSSSSSSLSQPPLPPPPALGKRMPPPHRRMWEILRFARRVCGPEPLPPVAAAGFCGATYAFHGGVPSTTRTHWHSGACVCVCVCVFFALSRLKCRLLHAHTHTHTLSAPKPP